MNRIEYFSHFLGRQPLFPYSKHNNSNWLDTIYNDKCYEELIYWSSPSLHKELLKLKKVRPSKPPINKVIKSLYSYWVRSYSRSTPFGINAGFYIVKLNDNNLSDKDDLINLENSSALKEKRVVTPDAEFKTALIKAIFSKTSISFQVRFYINPTIYKLGKSIRFHECLQNGNYRISSIEIEEIIDLIMPYMEKGLKFEEILELLGDDYEYQDRKEFVKSLIEENILINEFEYLPFDESSNDKLVHYLSNLEDEYSIFFKDILVRYQSIIVRLETSELGDYHLNDIEEIKNDLNEVIDKKSLSNLYHIDMVLPADSYSLNSTDLKLIKDAIECFSKIINPEKIKNPEIEKFKNVFFERYNNETIPLLEVLDTDCGLGFPVNNNLGVKHDSELLSLSNISNTNSTTSTLGFDPNLLDKIVQLPLNNNEIDLSKLDLSGVRSKSENYTGTFSVIGFKLPQGNILMSNIGGSSSLNLLGRFSIKDLKIQSLCKEILNKEKEIFNEAIIAEILFMPNGKSGNIVKRKFLSDFYIPINCGLDIPGKKGINLDDLYITIENGDVILISKKYNKRVIPRLSSAHNYDYSSSNIYKFLCNIQQSSYLNFSDDNFIVNNDLISSPRIKFKNLIIKPASWKIRTKQYPNIFKSEFNISEFKDFLSGLHIPNEIAIKEGDNELPLKRNNELDLKILWDYLQKNTVIELIEWLHYDSTIDGRQKYINQFILPLFINSKNKRIKTRSSWFYETKLKRFFTPNSEVLSFKIYCGAFISDEILNKILNDLGNVLKSAKLIKSYFFVRYADPHYHLRIRFFLNKYTPQKYNKIIKMVIDNILVYKNQRLIWKVEIDTYERELQRYSESNIELVEAIFYEDSKCFLNCLKSCETIENEIIRFSLGILNVKYWFKLVNFDFNCQLIFVKSLIEAFKDEFKDEIELKQINNLYREYKNDFNDLSKLDVTKHFINRNNVISKKLLNQLDKPYNIKPILKDIIHMSQNRIFSFNQRLNEFVVYVLVEKIIQSQHKLVNN